MGLLINLDTDPRLVDPMEFELNGMKHEIREVTEDILDEIDTYEKEAKEAGVPNGERSRKVLEMLTGLPADMFVGLPLRKKTALIQVIRDAITNPLGRPEPEQSA